MLAFTVNWIRDLARAERTLLVIVPVLLLAAVLAVMVCETNAVPRVFAACCDLELIVEGHDIVGLRQ